MSKTKYKKVTINVPLNLYEDFKNLLYWWGYKIDEALFMLMEQAVDLEELPEDYAYMYDEDEIEKVYGKDWRKKFNNEKQE